MMGLSGVLATRDNPAFPLRDLAFGLGRIPRFGGQTIHRWFVSDHLVAAARYARTLSVHDIDELDVLLHDAHEAYTGDIPTTFKTDDMRELQRRLDREIYRSLGLESVFFLRDDTFVRRVDRMLLRAEALVVTPKPTFEAIEEELGLTRPPLSGEAVQIVWEVLRSGAGRYWMNEVERLVARVTSPLVTASESETV